MKNAMHRTPCLETAPIKMLLNGPESFTPDGNFILGEAPELRGYFVCAGFNSAGIANSGGAGRLIAEWMVGGEAPSDLWDVDIRRFAPFTANRKALAERTGETLGLHYAMRWPRQELETGAAAAHLAAVRPAGGAGREFGRKNGWERANYFKPSAATPRPAYGLGRPGWLDWVIEEQRATREAVALYDQSSLRQAAAAGPRRAGRAAAAVRQRHRRAGGPHGLHRAAQRARRLRERPDGDPPGGRHASSSSPARRSRRAMPTGSSATSGARTCRAHATSARCTACSR